MQYATLIVAHWYPEAFEPISVKLHGSMSETLEKITAVYHEAFMTKYAGINNTIMLHSKSPSQMASSIYAVHFLNLTG